MRVLNQFSCTKTLYTKRNQNSEVVHVSLYFNQVLFYDRSQELNFQFN